FRCRLCGPRGRRPLLRLDTGGGRRDGHRHCRGLARVCRRHFCASEQRFRSPRENNRIALVEDAKSLRRDIARGPMSLDRIIALGRIVSRDETSLLGHEASADLWPEREASKKIEQLSLRLVDAVIVA